MKIRQAMSGESKKLSELAYASEAYWGYDQVFMNAFRAKYGVSEDQIKSGLVCVLEDGDLMVGFFYMERLGDLGDLEFFYIDPQFIGKGYGQVLWRELMAFCRAHDIKEIELVTSPQAVGFYEKMGAVVVGQVASQLREGRLIPKLRAVVG
jgi:ribosomal protein S18 acetylase RimI-like enzyme